MTKRITSILALVALTGCPTSSTEPLTDPLCVSDGPLMLETTAVQRPDDAELLLGVDLDGEVTPDEPGGLTDYTDPDGSPGVDSAGTIMDAFLEALFGHGVDEVVAGQSIDLDLMFERDLDGLCTGLSVGLAGEAPVVADWNGTTYRAYDLGSVPFALAFRDITTPVSLRDVAVRFEIDDGEITNVVVGGWISTPEMLDAMLAGLDAVDVSDLGDIEADLMRLLPYSADMDIDAEGAGAGFSFMFRVDVR